MGRGFNGTRLVLVLVLLGALYWIGKIVNPPPAGPPEAPKADPAITDKAPSKNGMKDEMMERMKKREEMMARMKAGHAPKPPKQLKPEEDPDQMAIKPDFFNMYKPGEQGLKEVEQKMARNKALKEQWQKEAAAAKAAAPSEKKPSTESASHEDSHAH
jgi:hypothetical protein